MQGKQTNCHIKLLKNWYVQAVKHLLFQFYIVASKLKTTVFRLVLNVFLNNAALAVHATVSTRCSKLLWMKCSQSKEILTRF